MRLPSRGLKSWRGREIKKSRKLLLNRRKLKKLKRNLKRLSKKSWKKSNNSNGRGKRQKKD